MKIKLIKIYINAIYTYFAEVTLDMNITRDIENPDQCKFTKNIFSILVEQLSKKLDYMPQIFNLISPFFN